MRFIGGGKGAVCLPAAVGDDLAVFEFDDAVGIGFGKFPVVRDDDDQFAAGELVQKVQNLPARLRIERARRFVGEDDGGVFDQRPRDGHALLLPAR